MYIKSGRERKTVHLHLELMSDRLSGREARVLREYGKVDKAISRDVLVPSSMTLHSLHYLIQRLFGWQNSHLHNFEFPEDIYEMLTGGMFRRWGELCGIYFRMPDEEDEDIYWDDDYDGSKSFRSWLRRKYCGPYRYEGYSELYVACQRELLEFYKRWPEVDIRIPFDQMLRNPDSGVIEKTISPKEATVEEINRSIDLGGDCHALLERLTLEDIMVLTGEDIPAEVDSHLAEAVPVTKKLKYSYDYGDGWKVMISLVENTSDASLYPEVAETEKPLCVKQDGLSVMDDVGGIGGYCEFLYNIHHGDPDERDELRDWARMQGWTGRLQKPENVL